MGFHDSPRVTQHSAKGGHPEQLQRTRGALPAGRQHAGPGDRRAWAHTLNLPFTGLVIVGNIVPSLGVGFLSYKIVLPRVLVRIKWKIPLERLALSWAWSCRPKEGWYYYLVIAAIYHGCPWAGASPSWAHSRCPLHGTGAPWKPPQLSSYLLYKTGLWPADQKPTQQLSEFCGTHDNTLLTGWPCPCCQSPGVVSPQLEGLPDAPFSKSDSNSQRRAHSAVLSISPLFLSFTPVPAASHTDSSHSMSQLRSGRARGEMSASQGLSVLPLHFRLHNLMCLEPRSPCNWRNFKNNIKSQGVCER